MEEMLCYAGSGLLNIKIANFPVHQQNFNGYVVGFQGPKLFCLQDYAGMPSDRFIIFVMELIVSCLKYFSI